MIRDELRYCKNSNGFEFVRIQALISKIFENNWLKNKDTL